MTFISAYHGSKKEERNGIQTSLKRKVKIAGKTQGKNIMKKPGNMSIRKIRLQSGEYKHHKTWGGGREGERDSVSCVREEGGSRRRQPLCGKHV